MIELVEYLVSSLVPDGDYTVEMRDGVNANDIVVTIAKGYRQAGQNCKGNPHSRQIRQCKKQREIQRRH